MDHGDLDRPGVSSEERAPARRPFLARGLACLAIVPLLGFIGGRGRTLWDEWRALRVDNVSARANTVIGYVGITPNPSLAARPVDWYHDEGDHTLLWSGYRDDGHRWFRFGRGDLGRRSLSLPIGRDAIRTIDYPIFERDGDQRWGRIPDEAPVAGLEEGDEPPVYPLRVLDKVVAVNDRLGDRSILVVYTPVEDDVTVYRADLDGRAVLMGQSGYFIGHDPVLYDRETESLWVEAGDAMTAVAGARKGASLPRLARVVQASWGDWKARKPRSRLLVGADRSKPTPPGPGPLAP